MAKKDCIPHSDDSFLVWHDQLKTTVSANIATFGLVAADATLLNTDNTDIHAKVVTATNTGNVAKQATADKATSRALVEKHARAIINRIKAHPAYTIAYGNLMGIIGPEDSTDLSTAKPTLTAADRHGGVVELGFNKSVSDGINLYSKRGAETEYTYLARDTSAPYVDTRPLLVAGKPELRTYKAVYVLDDAPIGEFSDEVVVTCAP